LGGLAGVFPNRGARQPTRLSDGLYHRAVKGKSKNFFESFCGWVLPDSLPFVTTAAVNCKTI